MGREETLRSLASFPRLAVFICLVTLITGSPVLAEDRDTASRLYQAFTIYERLGHKLGMAVNLNNVGYIHRMQGDSILRHSAITTSP